MDFLINELIKDGYLHSPEIMEAFLNILRRDFLRQADINLAEANAPVSIGFNQTISQPLTVAFMFELLQPKAGQKILDVGAGSGWTTALLAFITGQKGKVYGLEIIPELVKFGNENLERYNFIKNNIAQIYCTDGYRGLPQFAPFDRILVSAATDQVPAKLVKQLKAGGRMVIPIGEIKSSQEIWLIKKVDEKNMTIKKYPGFIFVPLVKK